MKHRIIAVAVLGTAFTSVACAQTAAPDQPAQPAADQFFTCSLQSSFRRSSRTLPFATCARTGSASPFAKLSFTAMPDSMRACINFTPSSE